MYTSTVLKIGESYFFEIPREVIEKFDLKPGDKIRMELRDEKLVLIPLKGSELAHENELARQLAIMEKIAERDREILRALAD